MYQVIAWHVRSDRFDGIVYSQNVVLDKMGEAKWYEVNQIFLYRDHEPMPHMTYRGI